MDFRKIITFTFVVNSFWLSAEEKPNVVLILADDFGYGSLNCYGAQDSLVRTPNINFLSDNGMRFMDASTPASISTPTRYGLLTGSYPWRSSLKYGVLNTNDPLLISPETITIADIFKSKGYNTAAIGKWHLGYTNHKHDYTKKLSPGPLDLGFDYHFGLPQNNDDYTGVYVENEYVYGIRSTSRIPYSKSYYGKPYLGLDAPQRENKNVMSTITDKAVNWIRSVGKSKPFFLYFAASAVHHPITPSDYMRGTSDAGPYGDFIQDLDLCVGRIIETLEYMGILDNTLIIFTSDNGGDIPLKNTPENYAIDCGVRINGELKGDKHTIWEGGTRVPFIAYWNGKITPKSVSNRMINLVDVYSTLADVIGYNINVDKSIAPDSFSFYNILRNDEKQNLRQSMITADVNGVLAIRRGGWKLIDKELPMTIPETKRKSLEKKTFVQLYNLNKDLNEQNNLISEYPKLAKELKEELERIKSRPSRLINNSN